MTSLFVSLSLFVILKMDDESTTQLALSLAAISSAVAVINQQQSDLNVAVTYYKQLQNTLASRYRKRKKRRKSPKVWSLPRPETSWAENTLLNERVSDLEFKGSLRIARSTFWILYSICHANITRKESRYRAPIPSETILAVVLYRLAHGAKYQECADAFNIGKSTVHEAFTDVVKILNEIKGSYIKFPHTVEDKQRVIDSFKERSSLPNVLGAIDGMHIKIRIPIENREEYFSEYQQYDIVCQGIVDGNTKFIHVVAGFPGSMQDSQVLRNTEISNMIDHGFKAPKAIISKTEVAPYLVGDNVYPLTEAIMTPFADSTTDPAEKKFNKELSRARDAVGNAYGMLKSRFQILVKGEDQVPRVIETVTACCVLHNICVDNGDYWNENIEEPSCSQLQGRNTSDGEELREKLKRYIYNNV